MYIFFSFSLRLLFYRYNVLCSVHYVRQSTMHAPSMLMCAPLFRQSTMFVLASFLLGIICSNIHIQNRHKHTTKFIIDHVFVLSRKLCSTIALIFIFSPNSQQRTFENVINGQMKYDLRFVIWAYIQTLMPTWLKRTTTKIYSSNIFIDGPKSTPQFMYMPNELLQCITCHMHFFH